MKKGDVRAVGAGHEPSNSNGDSIGDSGTGVGGGRAGADSVPVISCASMTGIAFRSGIQYMDFGS